MVVHNLASEAHEAAVENRSRCLDSRGAFDSKKYVAELVNGGRQLYIDVPRVPARCQGMPLIYLRTAEVDMIGCQCTSRRKAQFVQKVVTGEMAKKDYAVPESTVMIGLPINSKGKSLTTLDYSAWRRVWSGI